MCGRYFFDGETEKEIENDFGLSSGAVSMKAGDVTPSMSPLVLLGDKVNAVSMKKVDVSMPMSPMAPHSDKTIDSAGIYVTSMFWGLAGTDSKLLINARAETALKKPMFSDSVQHRRCVIPAAGFYEWDRDKNKFIFYRKDRRPIYLAGFYQLSENRDSFVILTTAANESMIKVHDRMPLMIEKPQVYDWLYDNTAAKELLGAKMPLLDSRCDYEQLSLF